MTKSVHHSWLVPLNSSITDPVSFFLLSSGAVFALVWALGQCLERRTGSLSYLSAATLASAGLWLLSGAHFFSGLYQAFPHLLLVHLPVVACIGPCLYFYYRKLIHPSIPIRPRDVAHFVPAILVAVALIPFYSLSPGEKIEIATGIRKDLLAKWFGVLNAFPKLSAIGYLSAFAIRNRFLLSLRAPLNHVQLFVILFGCWIVFGTGLGLFGMILQTPSLQRWSAWTLPLIIFALYLVSKRYPEFISELQVEVKRAPYGKSTLTRLDVDRIIENLQSYMKSERPFLDEDLKLADVADAMHITPHQLSEILNERLGRNFARFVNQYRIEEARRLLLEESDRTVLSIALAVGFNSKSAFNGAFLDFCGVTPSQFRSGQSPK